MSKGEDKECMRWSSVHVIGDGQGGRSLGNTDEHGRSRVYNAGRSELWAREIVPLWVRGHHRCHHHHCEGNPLRKTRVQHERSGAAASAAVRSCAREPGARRGEGGEAVRSGVPQGRGLHLRGLPLEEGPPRDGRGRRWWDHLSFVCYSRLETEIHSRLIDHCSLIWTNSSLCGTGFSVVLDRVDRKIMHYLWEKKSRLITGECCILILNT